ncbi:MAG: folate family ECF transporter S component [Halanaerobiales bacterium]
MKNKFPTNKLVYMALMMSLSIVLTRILSLRIPFYGVESIRIGFGGLPIILAGITMGPLAGGIVGALADLLGFWINPVGAYMPHFTITAFLTGFIPGIIFLYFFRGKNNYLSLLLSIAPGQIITSIILVPYFINTLFGAPLTPILIPRIIGEPISIILYVYFINTFLEYDLLDINKKVDTINS